MPKIIENLREELISTGKTLLMEKGYKSLTMRDVASKSKIAIGTVYNYFSSKDELVASIMFIDWAKVFSEEIAYKEYDNCIKALEAVYSRIDDFSNKYRKIWEEYGSNSGLTNQRHRQLVDQIHKMITVVFEHFEVKDENGTSIFISELILASAVREDVSFDMIAYFIERIIS